MNRTHSPELSRKPKLIENSFLAVAGVLAIAPLQYQLPRWALGLDPAFVHAKWIALSPFPLVLYMSTIHPALWILVTALSFVRLCGNYGWRLRR